MTKSSKAKFSITKLVIITAVIVALVAIGYLYWRYERNHPSTDDAYVQANYINIAAQISGPISRLAIQNLQYVKAGQLLFEIDPRPFQYATANARAQLTLTKQTVETDESAIAIAASELVKAQAQQVLAKKNTWRILQLVKARQASISEGDNAKAQLKEANAVVVTAQNQLTQAKQNLGAPGEQNARIKQAKAELQQANLNLSYTKVVAPTSGYITNFELRVGSTVSAEQPLFVLVSNKEWWVNANFEEKDLARLYPGQFARVRIDMYPGVVFAGRISEISRGSGASFSLLPPENATGNWVKVTQRFQVKVLLIKPNPRYPLRIGSSSTVIVDLNQAHPHAKQRPAS